VTGTVDDYVADQPEDVREVLTEVVAAVRRGLPGADESIRYGMPAFVLDGHGLHVGGWKRHVGLYPVPRLDDDLEAELAPYRTHKDTVRFLYRHPVPYDLVERVSSAIRRV
jgi:uncharacterized protein YdhG (YjbR/CyaY superfamily)